MCVCPIVRKFYRMIPYPCKFLSSGSSFFFLIRWTWNLDADFFSYDLFFYQQLIAIISNNQVCVARFNLFTPTFTSSSSILVVSSSSSEANHSPMCTIFCHFLPTLMSNGKSLLSNPLWWIYFSKNTSFSWTLMLYFDHLLQKSIFYQD